MAAKDSSKRKLEEHIEQVEAKIADVDRKVLEAEGDLQIYYREALVKLKEVRQVANAQLERLQETGEEAWDDLKDDMDEAIERLRSNLDALMARFGNDAVDKPAARPAHERENKDRGRRKGTNGRTRTKRGKRR